MINPAVGAFTVTTGASVSSGTPKSKNPERPTRELLKRLPSWPANRPRSMTVRSNTPRALSLPGSHSSACAVVGSSAAIWLRNTAFSGSRELGLLRCSGSVTKHTLAVWTKSEVMRPWPAGAPAASLGYTAPRRGAAQKWPPAYTATSVTAKEKMLEYMRADHVNGTTSSPAVS